MSASKPPVNAKIHNACPSAAIKGTTEIRSILVRKNEPGSKAGALEEKRPVKAKVKFAARVDCTTYEITRHSKHKISDKLSVGWTWDRHVYAPRSYDQPSTSTRMSRMMPKVHPVRPVYTTEQIATHGASGADEYRSRFSTAIAR